MKLGLLLTSGSPTSEIETARKAEAAGYNSVYTVDFFASNALVRLGAIAAVTKTIRVGTGIANTFTRSPMVLASAALDIDTISNGRLNLGLGTGLQRMNEEWYAVPFGKPVTKVKELIALLREVFATTGLGFKWDGEAWDVKIPAYMRGGGAKEIPIWLAAVNRGMIAAAGAVADGMVGHPVHSRKWHEEVSLPLLKDSAAAAGRTEEACPVYPHLITAIHPDRDEAIKDAKRQMGFSFSVEHYHTILDIHGMRDVGKACRSHLATYDFDAMGECVPNELVDQIAIACTPDEAADRLNEWRHITPEPMIFLPSIGVSPERQTEYLEQALALPGKISG